MLAFLRPPALWTFSRFGQQLRCKQTDVCAQTGPKRVRVGRYEATAEKPRLDTGEVRTAREGNGVARHADVGETKFEILEQKQLFRRYQTVYLREVRYPNGQIVSYDVLGNEKSNFTSVFVFPFDTVRHSVTMIREYSPGRNGEQMGFVAGMFEREKHDSIEEAARAELSEEAHLKGGRLIPLSDSEEGISADKYSMNGFHFFLCLDCVKDEEPKELDVEEWISIHRGVGLAEVRRLIHTGRLNTPNSLLGMLALDRLRAMGFE